MGVTLMVGTPPAASAATAKPKRKPIPWPDVVPVLTPRDFCRDAARELKDGAGYTGRHCLTGWARFAFPAKAEGSPLQDDRAYEGAVDALAREAKRVIVTLPAPKREKVEEDATYKAQVSVPAFNDCRAVPFDKLADVWNRAMRALGYTKKADVYRPTAEEKRSR